MKKYILPVFLFVLLTSITENSKAQLTNSNMTLLSQLDEHGSSYSACWGYTAYTRQPITREYAILGCSTGTAFVDITDTANIHEVDFLPGLTSGWREMKVYSHYAYIVSEATGSGLQIVDLQYLPDSVHLVNTYSFSGYSRTHTISQSGPYLYLNGGNYQNGGLFILDLTASRESPVKRGQWETFYVHDCRVLNDTIWGCNIYNPPGSISVIDATNKDNLQTVTSWVNNPSPFPHNCAITKDRRYIFTTDETSSPAGKLKVWNIENLSNITFVTNWQPTGISTAIVHNVEIYGNYAVIAHYTAGIRVVNITNPASPVEAAWYDTYPLNNNTNFAGCWGVFMFPSGKIIGSDISGGLFVVKTTFNMTGSQNGNNSTPSKYALKQNYPNPFNPSTKIEFAVAKNSHVTLEVYDAVGRQVGSLVDEFKTAGNYSVRYDASGLASGIYFYKLQSEGFSETKKMTLLK
jgi:choice-of-anchor B domain-containing protein